MNRISINEKSKTVRVWMGGRNAQQVYFTFEAYGGVKKALKAARQFQDSCKNCVEHSRCKPKTEALDTSESGIVGVSPRYCSRTGKHTGWRVQWTEGPLNAREKRQEEFSFFRYGDSALDLAIQFRRAREKEQIRFIDQALRNDD